MENPVLVLAPIGTNILTPPPPLTSLSWFFFLVCFFFLFFFLLFQNFVADKNKKSGGIPKNIFSGRANAENK